ncbi:hypothetical protein H072_10450 [Dactylellina haptotyla CBS 200.50]|uniref:Glycosyltransferase family 15 protein n=1 Tax=Dactylellina haptotyla (strain CBS 200.50) TaxID=1284197 RepID=S8A4E7_DACHA|nr:hypothetical protein H072_10450 [Dactylellina haptotyla CBS 200.50]
MAISQGALSKILMVGSVWIFLATLWFVRYWPLHSDFKPAPPPPLMPKVPHTPVDVPNPPNILEDLLAVPVRPDAPVPQTAKTSTNWKGLLGFGNLKDKFSSLKGDKNSQDEKKRPWKYTQMREKAQRGKEKATNDQLHEVKESMRRLEDRFNHRFNYPWTFMNDEPFTPEFISVTSSIASGLTEYVHIPAEHWGFPPWINQTLAFYNMKKMQEADIIYGGSYSYRNMCRFFSGFFFRQRVMEKYDWYWRVEPGVHFFCDQHYDPFSWLRENNKTYGFTMVMHDYMATIPSLWDAAQGFFQKNPSYISPNNMRPFMVDTVEREGRVYEEYNTCHFWTNFEIASLDLWRSEKYLKYFEWLDSSGGFYYERWGDAPVHSIALATMWEKGQVHFFNDIGYDHSPFRRCPSAEEEGTPGRCLCPKDMLKADDNGFTCFAQWKQTYGDEYEVDLTW